RTVRPAVIFVENVEEFQTWGPVNEVTNKPIKEKAGTLFQQWIRSLRRCGYTVEFRSLVASDYGTPTTRKRLFIVARCDGEPIVWPKPTHGSPRQIQRDLKKHGRCRRRPWRTAAEIINWSLPCPSIFLSPAEAKQRGCRRPLADKTMKRIAEGIRRYVIETADPFIVRCNHGSDHFRGQPLSRPLRTVTQSNGYSLVTPFVSRMFGKSVGHDCRSATGSVTQENKTALVTPFVAALQHGGKCRSLRRPIHTITASRKDCNLLVCPQRMSYYGERPGQRGRGRTLDNPVPTVTTENRFAIVSAFIAKHFTGVVGVPARQPFPTITAVPTQNQVVAATLIKNNHGDKQWFDPREPLRTIVAQGTHHAEVRAFLMRYYGSGGQWSHVNRPMPTITAKDRLCLGIVLVDGEPFQIVDIGMRMLTPRELFSAQGFPPDYKITVGLNGKPATKTEQVARCGNSVCPQVVEALVSANAPVLAAV
ncbi:MAG: DNA cytosine methyltransferase, partial [Planctomycetes bacterium]|nr:DNA cytosine methyltransferase [Planctomycetota bacterium]